MRLVNKELKIPKNKSENLLSACSSVDIDSNFCPRKSMRLVNKELKIPKNKSENLVSVCIPVDINSNFCKN
jgi:hypothetical protein